MIERNKLEAHVCTAYLVLETLNSATCTVCNLIYRYIGHDLENGVFSERQLSPRLDDLG